MITRPAVDLESRLEAAKRAARHLRAIDAGAKDRVLRTASELLRGRAGPVLTANAEDLAAVDAFAPPVSSAFRDRLALNPARLEHMAVSLGQVAALPEPVGEVVEARTLHNGLRVRRIRSPLGVILMIFESRPNVAVEAFSLAFKAGNVSILRGGKESMRTTAALYDVLHEAMAGHVPAECLWGITDPDRAMTEYLLRQNRWIDVVVPRGGDGLIDFVTTHARMPVIKNDRGMCHVYVHQDADLEMAARIVTNAKTERPGVCNAMETVLVHESIATALLPRLYDATAGMGLQWHACPKTCQTLSGRPNVEPATSANWDTEYLDLVMNCRVVGSLDEAIDHIERHGSRHSEAIVTRSADAARRFQFEVEAAAVYWNASTRFTDGFELGLGGELGISTQKLHVRGPVGLRELTSVRWVIDGDGQIRS